MEDGLVDNVSVFFGGVCLDFLGLGDGAPDATGGEGLCSPTESDELSDSEALEESSAWVATDLSTSSVFRFLDNSWNLI